MSADKFSAIWVSHSSISDYLRCPRLYFLNNIYKNPQTGRKISLTNPHLALGQVVHDVLESLSELPVEKRFDIPLKVLLNIKWQKVHGKMGGFGNETEETQYKDRALTMLGNVERNPGPILEKAIKLKESLPWYWLSEEKNIILCGKLDWIKYNQEDDTVEIIDFKTGKNEESDNSLQLSIYHLLLEHCQKRKIRKASYWYLDKGEMIDFDLPTLAESEKKVMEIALKIKEACRKNDFACERSGCYACEKMEKIINGKAEFVGVGEYNKEIYLV
ncbi:MAG: PD-(D/E)XK nuclease family protein [Candidatus Berkelbacteria bacterium]|nr:PD-(D/E)XK nuclease family protein [Candidatus Berkelbacteria bacterium]